MTKEEVIAIIIEFLEAYGSQVGSQKVRDLTLAEMTDENLSALIIPSTVPSTGEWVQTTLKTMMRPITNSVRDLETLKSDTINATNAANNAATGASNVNATLVNMTVTVTDRNGQSTSVNIGFEIYRRYGSVALMNADAANVPEGKFVIIATQDPTSEENARLYVRNEYEATDTENDPFNFLSDLDQASSAAWADWLENMKPLIVAAINHAENVVIEWQGQDGNGGIKKQAQDAINNANTAANNVLTEWQGADGTGGIKKQAQDAISNATTQANYAKTQGDYSKEWNEHPPYIGNGVNGDQDYWYVWMNHAYVKSVYAKGDDLHWDEMSEQEKENLARRVLEVIGFDDRPTRGSSNAVTSDGLYKEFAKKQDNITVASIATCESIIDELL